jgi:Ca-activated chloride channel family protein
MRAVRVPSIVQKNIDEGVAAMTNAYRSLLVFLVALFPATALAQGLLVDVRPEHHYRLPRPWILPPRPPRPTLPARPPQSYKIQELAVRATLKGQVAQVQVSQSFVNTGSRQMEVCFVFPLPYEGAVDRMTFMLDGKEYAAELLDAREARRIYEGYVRRNQDPALLEWLGTGLFKTSVFPVPPGAKRTVTMRYSQVCRTTNGLTEWLFPLSTAKYTSHAVENVKVEVSIESQVPIKNIYSPTHSIEKTSSSSQHSKVTYECHNEVPSADFRLLYDVGDEAVAASLLSYRPDADDEGYFLLLVSPEIKRQQDAQMRKTVQFVVDRSGSMSGKKIEQAKAALKFVLNNLNQNDLFNIIAYDSAVESFRPELQRFDETTRGEALAFIEGLYAGGSTNIDGALEVALNQLTDPQTPTYIVFLTDGLPTAGERKEGKIVEQAVNRNNVRARLFPFGVGYDVNSRLLDKLARTGFGQSNYVRPNENLEEHISRLYQRIGAPALVDAKITVDVEGVSAELGSVVSRVYPKMIDLFAGDQLVMVGRYKKSGSAKVTISGKVDGEDHSFDFPATLVEKSADDSYAFVEKLWAVRRVGEIIDEIDLHGKNQELIDEMVALATKHGILTPYTSFLADETSNLQDLATLRLRAGVQLDGLQLESGQSAFGQRLAKGQLQRAAQVSGGGFQGSFNFDAADAMGGPPLPSAAPMPGAAGRTLGQRALPGMMGGSFGTPATGPSSNAEKTPSRRTVLNVGGKTFFWRNDRWEDSVLTTEQKKSIQIVKRYSDEYFALVEKFGAQAAKYLAVDEPVVVVFQRQAYQF